MDREGNWKRYVLVKQWTAAFMEKLENDDNPPSPTFADIVEAVYLDGVTTILDGGYTKGAFFANWLSQHTMDEREKILQAAGEKGDKVHRTIDLLLTSDDEKKEGVMLKRETQIYNKETKQEEPIENDEWDCLLAFASFWNAHEPIVLVSELPLYNTMFQYAGTADAIIILTKACEVKTCKCNEFVGKIGLFDWKTSSGIRASYSAQVGAYSLAENIGEVLPPGQAIAYTAVLRVGTQHKTTGGYEIKIFDQDALLDAWQRFLGAKRIFDYEKTPFDPAKDILDIPDELLIHVPKFDMPAAIAALEAQMDEKLTPTGPELPGVPVEAMQKDLLDIPESQIENGGVVVDEAPTYEEFNSDKETPAGSSAVVPKNHENGKRKKGDGAARRSAKASTGGKARKPKNG